MPEEKEKRITISQTLNGDIIYHIARNSSGQIFARELTLEKLEKAIKKYKEPPPEEEETEHLPGVKAHLEGEAPKKPEPEKPKKLLQNDLKTKVEEKKEQEEKSGKKKSFWDKLK